MGINLGTGAISKLYLGATEIQKAYLGGTLVYDAAPAGGLLLDDYPGAAAAYSLRQLRTGVTNVVRVRRSSDNTESDFTADQVTDGTLTTWVGAGNNGFVRTWYDQSGNGNHAEQTTASNQPQLVSSGSLLTLNSKPAININGAAKRLATSAITYTQFYKLIVFNRTGLTTGDTIFGFPANPHNQLYSASANSTWKYFVNPTSHETNITKNSSQVLISLNDNNTDTKVYANASLSATITVTANITSQVFYLFSNTGTYGSHGNLQEFILYTAEQSTNRAAIETNVNAHYGIY